METQAQILGRHRSNLDAEYAAKYPNGRITIVTSYIYYGDMCRPIVTVSREFTRSVGGPAASVEFRLPHISRRAGTPEDWSIPDSLCDLFPVSTIARRVEPDTAADCSNGKPRVVLIPYSPIRYRPMVPYATIEKCLAALKRRGARPAALALVANVLSITNDQLSSYIRN